MGLSRRLNERIRVRVEQAWYGAPGWNRTSDPQLRRLMLYPTELRAHAFWGHHDIRDRGASLNRVGSLRQEEAGSTLRRR